MREPKKPKNSNSSNHHYGNTPNIFRKNKQPFFGGVNQSFFKPTIQTKPKVNNSTLTYIGTNSKIPYPITIRSFAPFKNFGGGFHGDKRGFSTSDKATARVHQKINFDTDKTAITTNAWSSPTWHKWNPSFSRTAKPDVEFTKDFTIDKNGSSKTFDFGTHYAGANPLTPGAPNINVFSDFSITEDKKAGVLNISGKLTGDNFPSTEAFITDPKGNNVFIGIGFYKGSPFSSLWEKITTERLLVLVFL